MPRATSDAAKILRGTFKPSRSHAVSREPAVPAPTSKDPAAPAWLRGEALKIWKQKVAMFKGRGQSIEGCEGPLAQYCAVEAEIIDKRKRKVEVKAALLTQHRIYANDFLETPASQQAIGKKSRPGNRFAHNGRRAPA